LESWGASVSSCKNCARDSFYAWLIPPEVAQAEIAQRHLTGRAQGFPALLRTAQSRLVCDRVSGWCHPDDRIEVDASLCEAR
jgi:hypothetical protein